MELPETSPGSKEKRRIYMRAYHQAYYKKNRESIRKKIALWREMNPHKRRASTRGEHYRKRYGITREDYEKLYDEQEGCCAICSDFTKLEVDHDHTRPIGECVRGLLCKECNLALGRLKDSPLRALSAFLYLERHRVK